MYRLVMSDIKFGGQPYTKLDNLIAYLEARLAASNIKAVIGNGNKSIIFHQNDEKKLFFSTVENMIKLKADDPRLKKKGRDYLLSERLTEKQFTTLLRTFSDYLDQIAISCSIKLYPEKDNDQNFIEIRDTSCNNYLTRWPKPETFPVERK